MVNMYSLIDYLLGQRFQELGSIIQITSTPIHARA